MGQNHRRRLKALKTEVVQHENVMGRRDFLLRRLYNAVLRGGRATRSGGGATRSGGTRRGAAASRDGADARKKHSALLDVEMNTPVFFPARKMWPRLSSSVYPTFATTFLRVNGISSANRKSATCANKKDKDALLSLMPYQRTASLVLHPRSQQRRLLLEAGTGAGKTAMFVAVVSAWLEENDRVRFEWLKRYASKDDIKSRKPVKEWCKLKPHISFLKDENAPAVPAGRVRNVLIVVPTKAISDQTWTAFTKVPNYLRAILATRSTWRKAMPWCAIIVDQLSTAADDDDSLKALQWNDVRREIFKHASSEFTTTPTTKDIKRMIKQLGVHVEHYITVGNYMPWYVETKKSKTQLKRFSTLEKALKGERDNKLNKTIHPILKPKGLPAKDWPNWNPLSDVVCVFDEFHWLAKRNNQWPNATLRMRAAIFNASPSTVILGLTATPVVTDIDDMRNELNLLIGNTTFRCKDGKNVALIKGGGGGKKKEENWTDTFQRRGEQGLIVHDGNYVKGELTKYCPSLKIKDKDVPLWKMEYKVEKSGEFETELEKYEVDDAVNIIEKPYCDTVSLCVEEKDRWKSVSEESMGCTKENALPKIDNGEVKWQDPLDHTQSSSSSLLISKEEWTGHNSLPDEAALRKMQGYYSLYSLKFDNSRFPVLCPGYGNSTRCKGATKRQNYSAPTLHFSFLSKAMLRFYEKNARDRQRAEINWAKTYKVNAENKTSAKNADTLCSQDDECVIRNVKTNNFDWVIEIQRSATEVKEQVLICDNTKNDMTNINGFITVPSEKKASKKKASKKKASVDDFERCVVNKKGSFSTIKLNNLYSLRWLHHMKNGQRGPHRKNGPWTRLKKGDDDDDDEDSEDEEEGDEEEEGRIPEKEKIIWRVEKEEKTIRPTLHGIIRTSCTAIYTSNKWLNKPRQFAAINNDADVKVPYCLAMYGRQTQEEERQREECEKELNTQTISTENFWNNRVKNLKNRVKNLRKANGDGEETNLISNEVEVIQKQDLQKAGDFLIGYAQLVCPKYVDLAKQLVNSTGKQLVFCDERSKGIKVVATLLRSMGYDEWEDHVGEFGYGTVNETWQQIKTKRKRFVILNQKTKNTRQAELREDYFLGVRGEKTYVNKEGSTATTTINFSECDNKFGEYVQVALALTKEFSEGVNFHNLRGIHVTNVPRPYGNLKSWNQIVGRGRRVCSHATFDDKNDWTVELHLYLTTFDKDIDGHDGGQGMVWFPTEEHDWNASVSSNAAFYINEDGKQGDEEDDPCRVRPNRRARAREIKSAITMQDFAKCPATAAILDQLKEKAGHSHLKVSADVVAWMLSVLGWQKMIKFQERVKSAAIDCVANKAALFPRNHEPRCRVLPPAELSKEKCTWSPSLHGWNGAAKPVFRCDVPLAMTAPQWATVFRGLTVASTELEQKLTAITNKNGAEKAILRSIEDAWYRSPRATTAGGGGGGGGGETPKLVQLQILAVYNSLAVTSENNEAYKFVAPGNDTTFSEIKKKLEQWFRISFECDDSSYGSADETEEESETETENSESDGEDSGSSDDELAGGASSASTTSGRAAMKVTATRCNAYKRNEKACNADVDCIWYQALNPQQKSSKKPCFMLPEERKDEKQHLLNARKKALEAAAAAKKAAAKAKKAAAKAKKAAAKEKKAAAKAKKAAEKAAAKAKKAAEKAAAKAVEKDKKATEKAAAKAAAKEKKAAAKKKKAAEKAKKRAEAKAQRDAAKEAKRAAKTAAAEAKAAEKAEKAKKRAAAKAAKKVVSAAIAVVTAKQKADKRDAAKAAKRAAKTAAAEAKAAEKAKKAAAKAKKAAEKAKKAAARAKKAAAEAAAEATAKETGNCEFFKNAQQCNNVPQCTWNRRKGSKGLCCKIVSVRSKHRNKRQIHCNPPPFQLKAEVEFRNNLNTVLSKVLKTNVVQTIRKLREQQVLNAVLEQLRKRFPDDDPVLAATAKEKAVEKEKKAAAKAAAKKKKAAEKAEKAAFTAEQKAASAAAPLAAVTKEYNKVCVVLDEAYLRRTLSEAIRVPRKGRSATTRGRRRRSGNLGALLNKCGQVARVHDVRARAVGTVAPKPVRDSRGKYRVSFGYLPRRKGEPHRRCAGCEKPHKGAEGDSHWIRPANLRAFFEDAGR